MSYRVGICGLLSLTLLCSSAMAAGPNDSARGAARRLGSEGLEAYDKGDFDVALDKLNRAYAVVRMPSVGLWGARAMVKKGLLVQASERYLEITRLTIRTPEDEPQVKAKSDATRERAELLPRIPQLTVTAPGIDPERAEVFLDGDRIAPALLGVPSPVNPGEHRLTLKVSGDESWELVTLRESESRQVTLRLPSDNAIAPAPLPDGSGSTSPPIASVATQSVPSESRPTNAKGTTLRTVGWVTVAVGGIGIVTGTVAGLLALSRQSQLEDGGCTGGHCYASQSSDLNGYRTMRTVSTVGFIVGGVGLATGVTLVLTAPRQQKTGSTVLGYVGLGSAGLAGRF